MRRTSSQYDPAYVEGWPRVNLIKTFAAIRRNRPLCWFSNEKGRKFGQCILPERGSSQVLLAYAIADQGIPPVDGEEWLPVEHVPSRFDPSRHYFRCPGCEVRTATLVCKVSWRCQRCHGLAYRRQLIPKGVIAAEAIRAVEDRIGAGRPAGMHQATYRDLLGGLGNRRPGAADLSPVASIAHQRIVTAEWVALGGFPGSWLRDYTFRNGRIEKLPEGWLD